MKKAILAITIISSLALLLSGCESTTSIATTDSDNLEATKESILVFDTTNTDETTYTDETISTDESFGSVSALEEDTFTLEEMLIYAIQDEYAARTEYEYILDTFDVTRPFSNIIKAEETHISLLLPLFEEFNLEVPEDTSSDHLIEVTDLQSTFETGVLAEELNIAMYNLFLEQEDLPQSVIDTFIKLRDASISHLGAFQKQLT